MAREHKNKTSRKTRKKRKRRPREDRTAKWLETMLQILKGPPP